MLESMESWLEKHCKDKGDCSTRISEAKIKHGMSVRYPRLYKVWASMKTRCNNPNRDNYSRYGGRGIYVCEEWNNSVEPFVGWSLENGYEEGLQLDRIDNDGPYSPNNCRWVTASENCRNKRNTKYLTLCGVTKPVIEWSEILGISRYTLYYWISEHGEDWCAKRVYRGLAGPYEPEDDQLQYDVMPPFKRWSMVVERFVESGADAQIIQCKTNEQAGDVASSLRRNINAKYEMVFITKKEDIVFLLNTNAIRRLEYHGRDSE